MSYRVVQWIMDHAPRHGGSRRAVLIAIGWHADDGGGGARPSQETLERRAGCSERTVRRALLDLEAAGEIEREGYSAQGGTVIWRVVGPDRMAGPEETPDEPRSGQDGRTAQGNGNGAGPANLTARSGQPGRSDPAKMADNTSLIRPDTADQLGLWPPGPSPLSAQEGATAAREREAAPQEERP